MARIFDDKLRPRVVGWDTETGIIVPGNLTPRLVCGTMWGFGNPPLSVREAAESPGPLGAILHTYTPGSGLPDTWEALFPRDTWLDAFAPLLSDEGTTLVAHNSAYDQGVSVVLGETQGRGTELHQQIVAALEGGRLADTWYRDYLIANAHGLIIPKLGMHSEGGFWGLADVVKRRFGRDISEDKKSKDCSTCNGNGSTPGAGGDVVCRSCDGAGKKTPWRMRYHELDGIPVGDWPAKAVRYAVEDSKWAALVAIDQSGVPGTDNATDEGPLVFADGAVLDEDRQQRAAWSLHLAAVWGMRTDAERVELWRGEMEKEARAGLAVGERLGFVRVKGRDKGKPGSVIQLKLKGLVEESYANLDRQCSTCGTPEPDDGVCECGSEDFQGRTAPRTGKSNRYPQGQTKMDSDTLKESGNHDLIDYESSKTALKAVSTHLPILDRGTEFAMTSRPGVCVRSGRTSWADPPLQQPPRQGRFRECFVPRPGYAFVSADWSGAETVALAQILVWLFGESAMADALLDGQDLHVAMGSDIMGIPYADAWAAYKDKTHPLHKKSKEMRQLSKALNFGFPGGLGAKTMVLYARDSYGVRMSERQAWEYKAAWLAKWPEMEGYFRYFTQAAGVTGEFTYPQWVSLRQRGGCGFTDGCNTGFQGLVADAFKDAMWANTVGCYMRDGAVGELRVPAHHGTSRINFTAAWERPGTQSPLYGSRFVLGVHDEIINETPLDKLTPASWELSRIMVEVLKGYCPDLAGAVKCDPAAMLRWYKDAELVLDDDGNVVPWAPDEDEDCPCEGLMVDVGGVADHGSAGAPCLNCGHRGDEHHEGGEDGRFVCRAAG
jgi:DNA polymerase I